MGINYNAARAAVAAAASAAALLAGCAQLGLAGASSLTALQQGCSAQTTDYGRDTQAVGIALNDAYVANRHGKLSQQQFCAFQAGLAQQYATLGTSSDSAARNRWVSYLNDQRALAVSWRAAVDPTLRGG